MEQIKISVVLPVYNVAKYIRESFDSLEKQTLKEVEFICVDDGSTDESFSIMEEYAQRDPRFILLQQSNQGVGPARNTGLSQATGVYVLFLDPDDFFELTLLEKFYQRGEETCADITICHAKGFDDCNQSVYQIQRYYNRKNVPEKTVFTYQDMESHLFSTFGFVHWNKLYRMSFLKKHDLKFQPLFRGEEIFFYVATVIKAEKMAVLDESLLYYRSNMDTAGKKKINIYGLSYYEAFLKSYEFLKEEAVSEEVIYCFLAMALKTIFNLQSEEFSARKALHTKIHEDMEKEFQISQVPVSYFGKNHYQYYEKIKATPFDQYIYERLQDERETINPNYLALIRKVHPHLCFFGAGLDCQKLLRYFKEQEIPLPVALCDNGKALQGTLLHGVPIYSFGEMLEKYPDMALIITLKNDYADVEEQVLQYITKKQIFRIFV